MMKLSRRYVRGLRENSAFYISATILTAITLLLYFMFSIAGNAILNFSAEFFPAHKLEDAHFTTYLPIPEEDIAALEETYHLTLEAQPYINIRTDDTTARVFHRTEKVDICEITVGRDMSADDEILISEGYAVNNGVEPGDRMQIGSREYTVAGLFQRPDYLYMLENLDDSYKNITTFYLAYMTDSAFEELGDTVVQYLVRYREDNSAEFRKAIHETYYMRSYNAAEENTRITMVNDQAELFLIMSYFLLCILPLIAVALVCITISRKVKSEQRLIGTLSAMGYRKGQLMAHYAGFAAIPGLLGGILLVVISSFAAQPYSEVGLQDYEPMRITGSLSPLDAVLGIVIPTVMYVIAALLAVRRLLKQDTVLLLNGSAGGGRQRGRRLLAGRKISFRVKFALRSVVGNPARSFVVLLGVFLGCFIELTGFAVLDSVDASAQAAMDTMGSYEYQYILTELTEDNDYGGEPLLISSLETPDGATLTLIGSDADNPCLNFENVDGGQTDISDGYYITSLTALIHGWSAGDTVTLCNPLSLEETEITVSGILQNDVMKAIFTTPDRAAELLDIEEGLHNALVSDRKLDIPESRVAQESRRSSIREQLDTVTSQMGVMVYLMIGLGAVICIAAIYVAVNMLVTENRSNISMLKVLGYRDRQINKIVLRVNHIFLPLGILLSIPVAVSLCRVYFVLCADMLSMLLTTAVRPRSYLITIALTTASYFVSLLLVRHKVGRVDMIESLKDNRE